MTTQESTGTAPASNQDRPERRRRRRQRQAPQIPDDLRIVDPTPPSGLTDAQVQQLRDQGHGNNVTTRSERSLGQIIRANLFTRINAILGVLTALVLVTGSWTNALFGLLIVVNSGIGILQEVRARRTLAKLRVIGAAHPKLRRNGTVVTASGPDQIVLGDLIELGPGDQILVDAVLTQLDSSAQLEVDESLLTGESDPVLKGVGDPLLSGSNVISGAATCQAVRVGRDSYANSLTSVASEFSLTDSQLLRGINRILRVVTWLLVPVGLMTIIIQLTGSNGWRRSILGTAAALVPMVPEGLVLMTSLAFMVGVIRLGRKMCLVQELPAIEGLARVDVVCADKTGTLTESGMRLQGVATDQGIEPLTDPELRDLLSRFVAADARPNASMLAIAEALGQDATAEPTKDQQAAQVVPFNSSRKFSAMQPAQGQPWFVLGAPDVLLGDGPVVERAQKLADSGLRVLAFGQADSADEQQVQGFEPKALLVLEQRIRPDAKSTIEYFNKQHVQVKIISGDNAAAIAAVGRAVGLPGAEPVDARTLPEPGPEFDQIAERGRTFGRVRPDQKQELVASQQHQGHTVAMTGDGVNDTLALKTADIGVAMGSGSAAARGVAQIVLLDDKFATLPSVVAEGRRVIGNIERVASVFLTKTVYSVVLAALIGVLGLCRVLDDRYPFVPIHVTITGWFTIGIPGFFLALAPNNDRARPNFVSRVLWLAVPAGIVTGVATVTTYLLVYRNEMESRLATQASTAALTTLLLCAWWVLALVAHPQRFHKAPPGPARIRAWLGESWRTLLVILCLGAYVAICFIPPLWPLLFIDPTNAEMMVVGLVVGGVGIGLISLCQVLFASRINPPESDDQTDQQQAPSSTPEITE